MLFSLIKVKYDLPLRCQVMPAWQMAGEKGEQSFSLASRTLVEIKMLL